jgi:hypothetical protein
VFDSFLSFLRKYGKKIDNLLSLMLNRRFKSLRLVSLFVGHEQNILFVEEYDWKSLKLLKCYHHLHHIVDCDVESIEHRSYEKSKLDIFEMTTNISELIIELVNREFLIFRRFQMHPKEIKYLLQWWPKHESMFSTIGFLVRQILGIVESQIELEKVFSLVGILTNLKRCRLQF